MNVRNFLFCFVLLSTSLVVLQGCRDQPPTDPVDSELNLPAAKSEAVTLLSRLQRDGGTPFNAETAVKYPASANVFMPSVMGLDLNLRSASNLSGPTCRMPMFKGLDPDGNEVEYIITEASNQEVARMLGVVYAPRMRFARGTAGAQEVSINDGRITFRGKVDFSQKRSVTPGNPNTTDTASPNFITKSEFPPAAVTPGAVADSRWSSYVVLPSNLVINAQIVANATGLHDRIPHDNMPQDNQNNPNLSRAKRSVILQILDGWEGGERYYYHLVTDASAAGPAAIELGVLAPRLASLPAFGEFPEGSLLGFSPSANGVRDTTAGGGPQGLNNAVRDQTQDPTNTFPIDPTDERFTPMWDAHIHMWTQEAIANGDRVVVKSIDQLRDLVKSGKVVNFVGNAPSPTNSFIAGLRPTRAIINCPVICQPTSAAIGSKFGEPMN